MSKKEQDQKRNRTRGQTDTEENVAVQEYKRKIPRTTRIQKEACERPVRDVKEKKGEKNVPGNGMSEDNDR